MSKRDFKYPVRVIEDFSVNFLLQMKSKLKALMMKEKQMQNKKDNKGNTNQYN